MIEENDDSIQFKLNKKQKLAFKRACFLRDTTMSREFRRFIYHFCENTDDSRDEIYEKFLRPYQ